MCLASTVFPATAVIAACRAALAATSPSESLAASASSPSCCNSHSRLTSSGVARSAASRAEYVLKDRSDAEQLVHLLLGRGVHESALRGAELDPAVGLQALQGFSHRLPADAEVLGQLVLDQVLAALQGAVHDQFHDRVVDGLAQGSGTLHPTRGAVGQHVFPRICPAYANSGREVTWHAPTKLLPVDIRVQAFVCNKLPPMSGLRLYTRISGSRGESTPRARTAQVHTRGAGEVQIRRGMRLSRAAEVPSRTSSFCPVGRRACGSGSLG